METRAVATMAMGSFEAVGRATRPFLQRYARKCGADLVEVPDLGLPCPHYNKLFVGSLLSLYNRVLWMDADILVRPDCPDLFHLVPTGQFGALNECGQEPDGALAFFLDDIRHIAARNGHPAPDLTPHRYLNTGLFLCDQTHRSIFEERPNNPEGAVFEQGWINLKVHESGTRVYHLPSCFNFFVRRNRRHYIQEAFIVHYSDEGPPEDRLKLIEKDIARWAVLGHHHHS